MYRRFGSEVTVVEKGPRLIQREDEEVSAAVQDILEAEGIRIRLRAECISFAQLGADIAVGVDCESGDREVVGSHVLLAVGRRPNTDDLGLDRAGIETDKLGYIMVDDQLRTNVPGVWALSPILPTTTSRSSRPTYSMAIAAASATVFPPMPFM